MPDAKLINSPGISRLRALLAESPLKADADSAANALNQFVNRLLSLAWCMCLSTPALKIQSWRDTTDPQVLYRVHRASFRHPVSPALRLYPAIGIINADPPNIVAKGEAIFRG